METSASWQAIEWLRILNFSLLYGGYIILIVMSLVSLRKRDLSYKMKTIWTLIILFFPVFGSIAFFIVNIGSKKEAIQI
jgi:hypothetical protein